MHSCIPVILYYKITLPQAIIGYFPPENLKMRCIFSGTDKSVPYGGHRRFHELNPNLSNQRSDTGQMSWVSITENGCANCQRALPANSNLSNQRNRIKGRGSPPPRVSKGGSKGNLGCPETRLASPFGRLGSPRTIRKVLGRLLCLLSCRDKKVRPPAGAIPCNL